MKTGFTFRALALTAAAISTTACVKFLWEVHYPNPNNYYSAAQHIEVASNGDILMTGTVKSHDDLPGSTDDSLFIARYSSSGELLWDRQYPGLAMQSRALAGNDPLLAHGAFSAFEVLGNNQITSHLITVDKQGNEIWRKSFNQGVNAVHEMVWAIEPAVSATYLYATINGQLQIAGLDGFGNVEWSYPVEESSSLNLGMVLDGQANVYLHNGVEVFQLPSIVGLNGIIDLELGFDEILSLAASDNTIAVIGTTAATTELLIMDSERNVLRRTQLASAPASWADVNMFDDTSTCYALTNGGVSPALHIGGAGVTALEDWQHQHAYVAQASVAAVGIKGKTCYVTDTQTASDGLVVTTSRFYRQDGTLADSVSNEGFAAFDAAMAGSSFYLAGIRNLKENQSDDLDGVTATLIKHLVW